MSYLQLIRLAAPEVLIALTALAVLTADLLGMKGLPGRTRSLVCSMVACAGCLGAAVWALALPAYGDYGLGMLVVDPLTQWVKVAVLALTCLALLLGLSSGDEVQTSSVRGGVRSPSAGNLQTNSHSAIEFTPHIGEYIALILLAAVGMMVLVSSGDILVLFVALELTSLSLYILAGFDKDSRYSAESSLKYFLFGGVSAAFTLFGLSYLYGLTGETQLELLPRGLQAVFDPLVPLALVLTLAGFGFKIAAVPFHLWAPGVYRSAPLPTAALVASASKIAGFFILTKLVLVGLGTGEGSAVSTTFVFGWSPLITVLAAGSMLLGNLAALVQSSVRRLLAFSAIAHAGYMLLAPLSPGPHSFASLVYYVVTYGLATVGAFGVVGIVERLTGGERMENFAGLGRRAPVVALCMVVFMLSLAGIPPLAGFFGKFYIFISALQYGSPRSPLLWLVLLALGLSAVSLYYYLQVLKKVYVAEGPVEGWVSTPSRFSQAVLVVLALAVLLLGALPEAAIARLSDAVRLAGL